MRRTNKRIDTRLRKQDTKMGTHTQYNAGGTVLNMDTRLRKQDTKMGRQTDRGIGVGHSRRHSQFETV